VLHISNSYFVIKRNEFENKLGILKYVIAAQTTQLIVFAARDLLKYYTLSPLSSKFSQSLSFRVGVKMEKH
jgi:hypothetical protein